MFGFQCVTTNIRVIWVNPKRITPRRNSYEFLRFSKDLKFADNQQVERSIWLEHFRVTPLKNEKW